jgi:lipoprotein-releasing system permease protein
MNRFPILKIVITHLTSRKRQTIVSMLGVTFGITVFIFQAGVITGLQDFFIEKTINSTAHIQIYQDKNQKSPPILRNVILKMRRGFQCKILRAKMSCQN